MGRPSRRTWTGAVVGVLVLAVTAACGSGVNAQWRNADGTTPSAAPRLAAKLTYTVENNAADITPALPIQVSVADGRLDAVNLANADGKQVQGEFDADKKTWKNSEELGYAKAYTLTVASTGDDGRSVQETRTFTTLKPSNFTLPYLRANVGLLLDGGTFGVGQPAVVWFDEKITDKVAAEKALTVTTDPVDARRVALDQRPRGALAPGRVLDTRHEGDPDRQGVRREPRQRPVRPGGPHRLVHHRPVEDRGRRLQTPSA